MKIHSCEHLFNWYRCMENIDEYVCEKCGQSTAGECQGNKVKTANHPNALKWEDLAPMEKKGIIEH